MKQLLMTMVATTLVSSAAFAGGAQSASHHEHETTMAATRTEAAKPSTDGMIRKIDPATRMITVQHGPIESLDMAAMTMPYGVKDPAMLTAVKPGDKVKMTVEEIGGAYTIVALQRVP